MRTSISKRGNLPTVINWWDFEFEKIDVPCQTSSDMKYTGSFPVGMPHLPKEILDCVFYLYETREAAERGEPFGGTGVFVSVASEDQRTGAYVYAVTNWHVAVRDGCSVIRVNKVGGGVEIFELDPAQWDFKPKWHDLAIIPMFELDDKSLDFVAISTALFVSENEPESLSIGPGEDVFMIGRFVDHDGADTNIPAARFGNISVMPQPIEQPTGATDLPSYILDMHSRTGYSGSPIFVYRTFGSELLIGDGYVNRTTRFLKVLGLLWGNFPEMWELKPSEAPVVQGTKLSSNSKFVKGMSGMSLAIPAAAILKMLNSQKHVKARAKATLDFQKANGYDLSPVALFAISPPASGENPTHREDFRSLLKAASKTPPQDD